MTDIVRFERRNGLLDIVMTDPQGGNLISNLQGDRIIAELAGIDESVRLVRIRSIGVDFCLGRVSPMQRIRTRPRRASRPMPPSPQSVSMRRSPTLPYPC